MKYWLSHLPLEVWVDVFCYPWISRQQLGRIVHKFGNHTFAEYLQFYLHDWGKRTLKRLTIDRGGISEHVLMESRYGTKYSTTIGIAAGFPRTPVPDNFKSFERISISHFDAIALRFLHQIGPLLTDVNLEFYEVLSTKDLRAILANLVPLLGGIHSCDCDVRALPTVKQFLGEKFNKINVLKIDDVGLEEDEYDDEIEAVPPQEHITLLVNWLTSPERDGNGPRLCKAKMYEENPVSEQFSAAIREEFLAAKAACTFAVILCLQKWKPTEFHLENGIGEQLHGVIGKKGFQITRHQANCGPQLQEWIKQNKAKSHRRQIDFFRPTFGLFDAATNDDNVEGDQQRPSTLKKA